jgi:hypothetical protein
MGKFHVVCINAKNKPTEIPTNCWVEEQEIYTVVAVQKMALQGGLLSFVLEEVTPPADSPFDSYLADRFRPATDDDFEAIAAVKELLEEVGERELIYL